MFQGRKGVSATHCLLVMAVDVMPKLLAKLPNGSVTHFLSVKVSDVMRRPGVEKGAVPL